MHAIARHSIVNLITFGLSRVIGLVLVGLIVAEYGLAVFGLLMLVRTFMPGTLFAIFDFGLPDIVARATARDLASGKRQEALRTALAAMLLQAGIGFLLAVPLVVAPTFVAQVLLAMDAQQSAMLAAAIVAHGIALPLLFAAGVAYGSLRGQERFKNLSITDVGSTLAYGLVSLVLIHYHASALYIAYAFLGSHVLRSLQMLWAASRGLRPFSWRDVRPDFPLLFAERAYLRAVVGRRVGGRLAGQLPRLVIAHILGAAAVGLFDAILRLPRFLKSMISMINSVVMPVVVRMSAKGDKDQLAQLAIDGPRLLLALASLISLPVICLAKPLLHVWLGAEVEPYWPWFSVLCALPLLSATAGFWNAMGRAELAFLRKSSVISIWRAAITIVVALPLLTVMGVEAVWLGLLCSMLYATPAVLRLNARRYGIPVMRLVEPVFTVFGASLPAAAVGTAIVTLVDIDDWPRLLAGFATVSAVQALMLTLFIVRPAERRSLLRLGRG